MLISPVLLVSAFHGTSFHAPRPTHVHESFRRSHEALCHLDLVPGNQGAVDELLGLRGATLFAACFLVVWLSGQVQVGIRLMPLAKWLGDITYGCYLLHPMFFFGWVWFVLPHASGRARGK